MSDFQISDEEIRQLLAEPITQREPDEIELQLAQPPALAERSRFRFAPLEDRSRARLPKAGIALPMARW